MSIFDNWIYMEKLSAILGKVMGYIWQKLGNIFEKNMGYIQKNYGI